MDEVAFVDASSVILLAAAGRLDLLRCAGTRIVVPAAVAREVLARGADDATAVAVGSANWIETTPDPVVPASVIAWDLGAGESAVLALATSAEGAVAVLDDLAARRCAAALGVKVVGTLGLVVRARRTGLVAAARPVVAALRDAGMYVSDAVIERALREIGE